MKNCFTSKKNVSYFIFFLMFSFCNCCIYYGNDYINFSSLLFAKCLLLSITISTIVVLILNKTGCKINISLNGDNKKDNIFFKSILLHTIVYGIVLLAYYPGIMSYDVKMELTVFSEKQSLLHSLYMGIFYNQIGNDLLHNRTTGIALASIIQLIIFSVQISFSHYILYRINIKKILDIYI